MKTYGYNLNTTHQATIFEDGTEAADSGKCHDWTTPGLIVGSSEWGWIEEDNARRICAALTYFSEASTEEVERLAKSFFEYTKARISWGFEVVWTDFSGNKSQAGAKDCSTRAEAVKQAFDFARQSGWTPPKWYQWWRRTDTRQLPQARYES